MDIQAVLQLTLITNMTGGQGASTMPDGTLCRQDSYTVQVQAVCNHMIGNYKLRFVAMGDTPFTNFTIVTYIPPTPVFTNPTSRPPPTILPQSAGTIAPPAVADSIPGAPAFEVPVARTKLAPLPPSPPFPVGAPGAMLGVLEKPLVPPTPPVMNIPAPPQPLPPLPARAVP